MQNSPQLENGYTKIANEILEELAKINLSSYQSRLLFVIIRKTYGFNKPSDWIANSQLIEETGLAKGHVSRTKKQLFQRGLILSTPTGRVAFNKNYLNWRELPKKVTVTNTGNSTDKPTPVTNLGNKVTNRGTKVTYIGGYKRNYTKETNILPKGNSASHEFGNENINKILKAIRLKVGVEDFKESQPQQRIWGNNLYQLMLKIQPQEFARRLDVILKDNFKYKNCGSLQFIYKEIKAFIEPASNVLTIEE